jgi:hypothetical protein
MGWRITTIPPRCWAKARAGRNNTELARITDIRRMVGTSPKISGASLSLLMMLLSPYWFQALPTERAGSEARRIRQPSQTSRKCSARPAHRRHPSPTRPPPQPRFALARGCAITVPAVERAAEEGLAPVQPESAAAAAQPAAPQVDRCAIAQDTDRAATAQDVDRFAVAPEVDGSATAQEADQAAIANTDDASRYCPVCSQRLESRHCKLICPVCGYYMSCADYY